MGYKLRRVKTKSITIAARRIINMQQPAPFDRAVFNRKAAEHRYAIADMMGNAGSGHIGGAFSIIEILLTLYWRVMNVDAKNPQWPDRDRFILSKGHAGPGLYATLAFKGYFPTKELLTLNKNGTNLPSHCDMLKTIGIDMTAGSLGQGLSAAVGMALAAKMDKKNFRVYSIIGDGESNEGQIWEAAMFAGHRKLDNLMVFTDFNKFQIDGPNKEICDLEPLADKWRAFNWEVFECDGHSWDDIFNTIEKAKLVKEKPVMIIAHTLKGKGHPAYENKCESHNIRVADAAAHKALLDAISVDGFEWPPR
jgi:transketolase